MILRAVIDQVLDLLEREPELAERLRAVLGGGAEREDEPRLVDRAGLAHALGCSLHHVDRLRSKGCPRVQVGDVERFEPERVIEWLRGRAAGLRVVGESGRR